MMTNRTHLDLFSGIGGFAIAAQRCGYRTAGFCEIDEYAQEIIKARFGAVVENTICRNGERGSCKRSRIREPKSAERSDYNPCGSSSPILHSDIFTLNGGDYRGVTLLTGGFPCQPYSCAGKRRGAADDRALWPEMCRVIDEARPDWVLGENVAGIITMELDRVLSDLESIGYSCWPLVIPAVAVDAKHRRDRVWIVGHANDSIRPVESQRSIGYERGWSRDASQDVADAKGEQARGIQPGGFPTYASASCNRRKQASSRISQSSIRGMADGLREGLDACSWPAEDPKTPRVSTGISNRAARLKALGNAIVPQVAEEIIRAIVMIEES